MKEYLLLQVSNPANWGIALLLLIQFYKLTRPYLPEKFVEKADKVEKFFDWAIPASYRTTQDLQKSGFISKSSKLSTFLDELMQEANKQNVALSAADLLKAKTIVKTIAANDKENPLLTVGMIASPLLPPGSDLLK